MESAEPFTVERSTVAMWLLTTRKAGWPVWAAVAAGSVLSAIGAILDVRLLIVGLMICVAIAPGVAATVYFLHTLSPEIVPNLLPHTLERNEAGFLLRLWRQPDADETEESEGGWMETRRIELKDADIIGRKTYGEYETLYYKDSGMKILYVPRFKK